MSRYTVQATWEDVPHLTRQQKDDMWGALLPYQRDARSKGIPSLGAGAIYPVAEADILTEAIEIQPWWRRVYSMDVGWNRTAAVWGAIDPESDVLYIYSEHYRGQAEPAVHAQGIRSRGEWIPGVIDPAARGRSQVDGTQLLHLYMQLGLKLTLADNSVESGIYEVWSRMSSGRLKIFRSCVNTWAELRLYRRDEKGKIVKENDHLMDCLRYLVVSGLRIAAQDPLALQKTFGNKAMHQTEYHPYGQNPKVAGEPRFDADYKPYG